MFKFFTEIWNFSTWRNFLHRYNPWYPWQIWGLLSSCRDSKSLAAPKKECVEFPTNYPLSFTRKFKVFCLNSVISQQVKRKHMVEHVLQLEILMIFCVPTWEKYNWWRLNHAWMMKMSNWHIWCPAVVKNQEGPLLHFCICWSGLSCNSLHSNNGEIFAKILLNISFEYFSKP